MMTMLMTGAVVFVGGDRWHALWEIAEVSGAV